MSRSAIGIVVLAVVVGLPSVTLARQGRGRGQTGKPPTAEEKQPPKADRKQDRKTEKTERKTDRRDEAVVFDRDRYGRVIKDYGASNSLPPGLAKRESLPPGLRRQLRERGTLPPGLQGRLLDVPGPLGARLPPVPAYYHRYFAGDDLLVVDTRTNRIAAVIRDVWR